MTRIEQARWHGDRWYGSTIKETLAGGATRKMHHEEARCYYFTTTGVGVATASLPIDVRNFALGGPYFTVWNDSSSAVDLAITSLGGDTFTVQAGKSRQVYLHDNSSAGGSWTVLAAITTPALGVLSHRVFVS